MMCRIHALGGWGVPPEHFASALRRRYPGADVSVYPPTDDNLAHLIKTAPDTELVGWSLGAHLLQRAAGQGRIQPERRLTLFAPFDAFPVEAGSGGKVALTQVKFLRRMLRRDPIGALRDFHRRAGLSLTEITELPYPLAELEHGLDLLENLTLSAPLHFTEKHVGIIGSADTLLDAEALAARHPGLRVVPGAGHDVAELLTACAP